MSYIIILGYLNFCVAMVLRHIRRQVLWQCLWIGAQVSNCKTKRRRKRKLVWPPVTGILPQKVKCHC